MELNVYTFIEPIIVQDVVKSFHFLGLVFNQFGTQYFILQNWQENEKAGLRTKKNFCQATQKHEMQNCIDCSYYCFMVS